MWSEPSFRARQVQKRRLLGECKPEKYQDLWVRGKAKNMVNMQPLPLPFDRDRYMREFASTHRRQVVLATTRLAVCDVKSEE